MEMVWEYGLTGDFFIMADETSPYVDQLFKLGQAFAVPLAQSIVQSPRQTGQASTDVLADRINWAALNGSGPNDPVAAAKSAPQTLRDFINGVAGATQSAPQPKNTGIALGGVGLLAVLVVVAIFILRK